MPKKERPTPSLESRTRKVSGNAPQVRSLKSLRKDGRRFGMNLGRTRTMVSGQSRWTKSSGPRLSPKGSFKQ
eukprot:12361263-Heterocapsa_arctica.AAC.1